MKNVVVLFSGAGFTSDQYDKVWDGLRAAGLSHPKGLISHVGFTKPDGSLHVVDVWESAEAFGEFGKTLMPIMEKNGINVPEPVVVPAHYVYQPETVPA